MEDRFVVNENMNNTGVSLFAVFDGHGGEVCLIIIKNQSNFYMAHELKQYNNCQ